MTLEPVDRLIGRASLPASRLWFRGQNGGGSAGASPYRCDMTLGPVIGLISRDQELICVLVLSKICGNEHEHEDEEKILAKEQIPEAGFSKPRSSLNIAR
jgi:hypothetical protein